MRRNISSVIIEADIFENPYLMNHHEALKPNRPDKELQGITVLLGGDLLLN